MEISLDEFIAFIALMTIFNIGFLTIVTIILKDHVDKKISSLSNKLYRAIKRYSENLAEDVFNEEEN